MTTYTLHIYRKRNCEQPFLKPAFYYSIVLLIICCKCIYDTNSTCFLSLYYNFLNFTLTWFFFFYILFKYWNFFLRQMFQPFVFRAANIFSESDTVKRSKELILLQNFEKAKTLKISYYFLKHFEYWLQYKCVFKLIFIKRY